MKYLSFIAMAGFGLLASFSVAQAGPDKEKTSDTITHVVELFTSQGCSSCPPANRTVARIADNPGVLALSYGVTYWDYLGWKDSFGDPKFTDRQRDYQKSLDGANLYTPQIVLNGAAHSPRFSVSDINSMPLANESLSYETVLSMASGSLTLTSNIPAGGHVAFVKYKPGVQEVAVKRGENHGRTLKIANVVTDVQTRPWTGDQLEIKPELANDEAYAAIFHAPETAKIISAVTLQP